MSLAHLLPKFSWLIDAAMTAAIILAVVGMAIRMLLHPSHVLLSRAAPEQRELMRGIFPQIPGVVDVEAFSTREAGKKTSVDLTLAIDRETSVPLRK